jgi:hypothetical protein
LAQLSRQKFVEGNMALRDALLGMRRKAQPFTSSLHLTKDVGKRAFWRVMRSGYF